MPPRSIYVISDIHLGGAAPTVARPFGFQLCPLEARTRLASLIRFIAEGHAPREAELIINGDFIDFLAEEDESAGKEPSFSAFSSEAAALIKIKRVIERTDHGLPKGKGVFDALKQLLVRGHRLSVVLGNHDLELSLPAVREHLQQFLVDSSPGVLSFHLDGEALRRGNGAILIEHGNRYDGWNAVSYGDLRAHRSALSRNEPSPGFRPPPGSDLVVRVLNPLKAQYRFLDLLKPENEAAIPLVLVLRESTVKVIVDLLPLLPRKAHAQAPLDRPPQHMSYIASFSAAAQAREEEVSTEAASAAEATELVLREFAPAPDPGSRPAAQSSQISISSAVKKIEMQALRRSLKKAAALDEQTFSFSAEEAKYLEPARRLAQGTVRFVLFGHTHHPKRIDLSTEAGAPVRRYLNTGSWCPRIRLPAEVYTAAVADQAVTDRLTQFLACLKSNDLKGVTEPLTTVACATLSAAGEVESCELFEWNGESLQVAAPRPNVA